MSMAPYQIAASLGAPSNTGIGEPMRVYLNASMGCVRPALMTDRRAAL